MEELQVLLEVGATLVFIDFNDVPLCERVRLVILINSVLSVVVAETAGSLAMTPMLHVTVGLNHVVLVVGQRLRRVHE